MPPRARRSSRAGEVGEALQLLGRPRGLHDRSVRHGSPLIPAISQTLQPGKVKLEKVDPWTAASIRFRLAFSSSSAFSRRASDTSRPPYLAFHL